MKEYGVDPENLPALIIIPPSTTEVDDSSASDENIRYDGGDYTRHRLSSFLSKHALKEKVFSPIETKTDEPSKDKPEEAPEESADDKQKVHTEF
jgi:hypothetical protein